MSDEQLLEIANYATSDAFDERERLVLELATRMSGAPVEVPVELGQRLREHFDEAQLVELAAAIAWENYRGRFNRALGVPSDGFTEGAVCALPARGGEATPQVEEAST